LALSGRSESEGERPARVTLQDIAADAQVSRSTVSLVVRESPLVAAATRERVLATMDRLGYVYNRGAASMRSGRSRTIGLVVCEITNPFYAEMTAGIERVLDRLGWLTFLCNTNESPQRQDRFIQRIREQGVDGIILSPAEGTTATAIEELQRCRMPLVQTLRTVANTRTDYVGADYRLGMDMATEHLVARGHRRIAYLGGIRRHSASDERIEGYLNAMARHRLSSGPLLACPSSRAHAADAVGQLLAAPDRPTAIVCYNDIIAFGAMTGLAERGIEPGRDVAIVGFDNVAEAALSRPRLTTVATGADRIGEMAAELLLQRIARPGAQPERMIIAPRLIVRET
jgi:LacI family transcriptional regulator